MRYWETEIIVFAIFLGIAFIMLGDKGRRMTAAVQSVADAMYKITAIVMEFSPIGVCALLADSVGSYGLKECRDVSEENWLDVVAGYTTILDMTEESILKGNEFVKGNPRYLCIVKNFPTFFSFGPQLVTPDEVPDVLKLEVQSVHNGEVYAKNVVANMTHRPARLVSLHSSIQGWYPGDVLSTGTPRAFGLADGDVAECRIVGPDGFSMEPLKNPVVDLKKHPEKA